MNDPNRDPSSPTSTGPLPETATVAVSPHYLASEAALQIMGQGGTALDGAIAADAMLAVVAPDTCGPGGDLFAIVHRPGDEQPLVLNASGRAGSGASAARLRDQGLAEIPLRSPWSITVPGCVDGWEALIDRFSALTLADDLAPAIVQANNGFPVSFELAGSLDRLHAYIGSQASATTLYPAGNAPPAGATLRRPALAATLAAIAFGGRSAFYHGPVGDGIVEATDGVITAEDLGRRQIEWVAPASTELFGLTAWTVPPNSQGWITLAALRIFEMLDPPRDPGHPDFQHALIESYRAIAWERADTTTDPDTAPLSPEQLLDPERLAERAAAIDRSQARRWPIPTGAPGGTAYLTTRDSDGMVVSFIQSNFWGIGSGISAGATGVWLHNRGAGFSLRPGHPNELTPGRRPLHTLAPTLWTDGARTRLVLGTRGGDQQPQILAQVAANQLWAGLDPREAQRLPRWSIDAPAPGDLPTIRYEPRYAPSTIAGLTQMRHVVESAEPWEAGWGPVSTITLDGGVHGEADPRVSTATALGKD
ncbi:MAG: gamma-glutamyltransferase [Actinomycetota bacterium]|nr:gamma-glutamyltransferase [Actinomycetota bacterium]